ncbi:MAG TPA: dihydropteroate synthase, partial [Firmicutes bacterium]|nr:dihydropteroate synthase [Bacillota bacterium]
LEDAIEELKRIGCDTTGVEIMAHKALHRAVKLEKVNPKAANLLKQTMLAKGGEAAVNRSVADFGPEPSDVLLLGTLRQFRAVREQLSKQPWGLAAIARELRLLLEQQGTNSRHYRWGEKQLVLGRRTAVMGILNITPDSFSDG